MAVAYLAAQVIDGISPAPLRNAAVVVEGGHIIAVCPREALPTDATVRDFPGATLLTLEELRAGVEEAPKADRRVAAHAYTPLAIRQAVGAGVDSTVPEEAFELVALS